MTVLYDADFYPFGGERTPYTNTCPQNYKFEGKERDTETGNDDFGARYYSNRFGRWLSADWSAVSVPVPYANLTNPQTLNLYAMVADDPESFADLDGHDDGFFDNILRFFGLVAANDAPNSEAVSQASKTVAEAPIPGTNLTNGQLASGGAKKMEEAAGFLQTVNETLDPTGVYAVTAGRAAGLRSNTDVAMSYVGLGLGAGVEKAIGKAQNILTNRFTTETFQAAAKEARGMVVALRPDGKPFDHIGPLREGLKGLTNSTKQLTNALKDDSLSQAAREAIKNNLKQINSAIDQTKAFFKKNNIAL